MNRSRLVSLLVAVLAVFALAVGAAVIDAPTTTQGTGGGSGGGSGGFFGSGSAFSLGSSTSSATIGEFPRQLFTGVLVLLAVVSVVLFVLLYDEFSLADLRRAVLGGVALAVLLGVVYLAIQLFGGGGSPSGRNGTGASSGGFSVPGGGSGGTADTALQPVSTNLPVLALAVGAVLVIGLAVVFRPTGDGEEGESEPESGTPAAAAGIGRAAGRAADRIAEDAALENEVYRAWREMTGHLDVARPKSSTPGEFARAATDAGMDDGDIDELTQLFTRVRYGDDRVTDDRERRAVAALRRIEDAYAEES